MKFLDVKTDYAFKKVFASTQNKPLLIKFLNSVITFPNNTNIKDLDIIDPYNIPMLKGMKDSFVDVKALLDNDSTVIIEMQVLNHQGFEKRVLYNMAKNYSVQLNTNEDYHLLNPIIALSIVDFIMFEDTTKTITNFKLLEKEEFINYTDDIELIFIELPKFKKELKELTNIKDKFIYFIKNAQDLSLIPKELKEISQALDTVNEASLTKEELELQHKRKEFIYIQKNAIILAKEQGIEQGEEKRNIEIAKNSILQGLDNKVISLITNLSIEVIQKLRDTLNK